MSDAALLSLACLTESERELMICAHCEQQTQNEIAERYGISQPTASRKIRNATAKLRRIYEDINA